jgi:hypothetical protein
MKALQNRIGIHLRTRCELFIPGLLYNTVSKDYIALDCMIYEQIGADRGDGLQIWRVAANMLNKQSLTAESGWSSRLGVGLGANNPLP